MGGFSGVSVSVLRRRRPPPGVAVGGKKAVPLRPWVCTHGDFAAPTGTAVPSGWIAAYARGDRFPSANLIVTVER